MRRLDCRLRVRDTVLLSWWLFADLLLALAVIFHPANTVGVRPRVIPMPLQITPARPPLIYTYLQNLCLFTR